MKELARVFLPRFVLALLLSLGLAVACAVVAAETPECAGADVFTTPREALLREKSVPDARIVARLPQGTRLVLTEARDAYWKVEAPGLGSGWISREVGIVFSQDPASTGELVTVGRLFGRNESNRRLAASLLLRASERRIESKTPDPEVEVLLGETAERIAASTGPYPKELGIVEKPGPTGPRGVYSGAAFRRALEFLSGDARPERTPLRDRAAAGALRAQYSERSASLAALAQETDAWLALIEIAEEPSSLRSGAERSGAAALSLGRYLLALGKLDDLRQLEERVGSAGARVTDRLRDATDGARLSARAAILHAMRGNGTPAFPQEARVTVGVKTRVVRIDGKLGTLQLTCETQVGGTHDVTPRKASVPILPVPGSLRISPDGRSVAWVEVAGPSVLVPVTTSLERDEPAREVAFLSTGRPLRDRALAHVVSTLSGFSKDGQRLGLSIQAWNQTPGPAPRYSVVSMATGELLFETSKDLKSFERLLQ